MPEFKDIYYTETGQNDGKPVIVWGHGWGRSHKDYATLIKPFENTARHIAVDFPGFGSSPPPKDVWSTRDYADALAELIKSKADTPIIWVGHSFGCRVGMQLAIHYPELIEGLFLIGGAGLRRKRSLLENIILYSKIYTYKALKKTLPLGLSEDWLKGTFGSPDYRSAGPMRPIMVKVNAEDMTDVAPQIQCPVKLIYGTEDRETPPEIGERLEKLIPKAEMVHLKGQDHYTVLSGGHHQVIHQLKKFIEEFKS